MMHAVDRPWVTDGTQVRAGPCSGVLGGDWPLSTIWESAMERRLVTDSIDRASVRAHCRARVWHRVEG